MFVFSLFLNANSIDKLGCWSEDRRLYYNRGHDAEKLLLLSNTELLEIAETVVGLVNWLTLLSRTHFTYLENEWHGL